MEAGFALVCCGLKSRMLLDDIAAAARACTACQDLPLGPRPILRVSTTATILIASQASRRNIFKQRFISALFSFFKER